MKHLRNLFSIIVLLSIFSCNNNTSLKTGDLLFVEGSASGEMDQAIMRSTGAVVHVGIVEVEDGKVYVIDASPKTGVSRRSLEVFIDAQRDANGIPPMHQMRLKQPVDFDPIIAKAKQLCGMPYDYSFLPDNDQYYCSELVYECYTQKGEPLFEAAPMNFRNADGSYDPYWVELFGRQGLDIPQDVMGTNPEAMSKASCLKEVCR